MKSFLAAAVQMQAGPDKDANLAAARDFVARAAAGGAALIALPEVFAWRGPQSAEPEIAEPLDGAIAEFASECARRHGVHLVAGSFLETAREPEAAEAERRSYNTTVVFDPDGTAVGIYRKIHLFDVSIEGQVDIRESDTRRAGDEPVVVDTELGKIGLAICYDLRFPELFRRLTDEGAEIFVMPSAFTEPTGRAHWHPLVRARAIENQCYFVAPNQYGETRYGFSDYGHSLIVDPWGKVLADGGEDGPRLVEAELDAARLAEIRSGLPALEHRQIRS
jgi:predicted amidohydrolase